MPRASCPWPSHASRAPPARPAGTGKTLTATYLAGALQDRTAIVLTGPALELVRASCRMARDLQPSMVILEDIDLIAQERTAMSTGAHLPAVRAAQRDRRRRRGRRRHLRHDDEQGRPARAGARRAPRARRPGGRVPVARRAGRARLLRVVLRGPRRRPLDVDALVEQTQTRARLPARARAQGGAARGDRRRRSRIGRCTSPRRCANWRRADG